MKHLFVVPLKGVDVQRVIESQARKFIPEQDLVFWHVGENFKDTMLKLKEEDLGDYFIFCPPWTVLLESPDFAELNKMVGDMKRLNLSYVRLRKIGNRSQSKIEGSLFEDKAAGVSLVPYLFKTSEFYKVIETAREKDRYFWLSLEVGRDNPGAVYYRGEDQPIDFKLSYWRCGAYHTITDILLDGQWSDTYMDYNGEVMKEILSDLGIDPSVRGVASVGGCCYDLG